MHVDASNLADLNVNVMVKCVLPVGDWLGSGCAGLIIDFSMFQISGTIRSSLKQRYRTGRPDIAPFQTTVAHMQ